MGGNMLKFKSIKSALLSIVLSFVIVGMLSISLLGYFSSKSIINNEIAQKMKYQAAYITEGIDKRLLKHDQLVMTLGAAVESFIATEDEEVYKYAIKKALQTNEDTYATGVWFEPYHFSESQKYFGPYAYKEGQGVIVTMNYSNKTYDYFKKDWYVNAKNNKGVSYWTDAYYNKTANVTMISTSFPFTNQSDQFAGAVTADINLSSIQDIISENHVGESGHAFLLNSDGMYLADRESEKVIRVNILDDPNESLANIGAKILETQEGQDTYLEADGKYRVYYSAIPKTNWIIGLTISEKELYSSLNKLLISTALTLLISLIIVSMGIILYTNSLSRNMGKLTAVAQSLAKGNFTVSSNIDTKDEIGMLSQG